LCPQQRAEGLPRRAAGAGGARAPVCIVGRRAMGGVGTGAQANSRRVESARCRAGGPIARSPRSPHRGNRRRHAHAKGRDTVKVLLLNPNTTAEVTGLLYAAGHRAASPGTELVGMTAKRGVPYIATRAEAQIGGAIALEMLAEA